MEQNSVDVSIIIVNYNTTAYTIRCIEAVNKFTTNNTYEIILVDNASADTSIETVSEKFPEITYIRNAENIGFGRANNVGIVRAKGKYVFLLNTDAFLVSDAIGDFYTYMEHPDNANVACCGADLIDEQNNRVVSYGNFPSVAEAFSSIGFSFLYKSYYKKHIHSGVVNYSDDIKNVDYLCGADMFIRKSVLDDIGAFDPEFFLYFEETELSYRIYKAGHHSVLLPYIKIIHIGGGSQKTDAVINYKQVELFSKSRMIFFRKCYGQLHAALAKFFYTIQAGLFVILKGKKEYKKVAAITWKA